jgi:tetratricopeptide (TPR) repeat protein
MSATDCGKQGNHRQLTVAMIVRDSEKLVIPTLDCVREIADEILVADTGSIDRTRPVALARATKVVTIPWTDDFSAARNALLDRASGEWVLWLDAGETISAETAAEIRRFVDEDADPAHAYLLMVRLPAGDEALAAEQVGRVRLIPNNKALRFSGRVREQLQPAMATLGMTIEPMTWHVLRSLSDHDPAAKKRKARRDLKLAELSVRDAGPTASALLAMGEAWSNMSQSQQAIDCFQQAMRHCTRGSTDMLEAYYGMLAAYESLPDAKEQQVQTCVDALEIFPHDAQLLCAMANYMQNRGRVDLACRAYRAAVEHGQVNLETWHLVAIREVAMTCLSMSLELMGDDEEARKVLDELLKMEPQSVRLRRRIIDLLVKKDRRREALEHASHLPTDDSVQADALRGAVRGACLAAKGDWSGARAYLQVAYDTGCRDVLCLKWLSIALFSLHDYAGAAPIVAEWQAAAPGNLEAQKYAESLALRPQPATPIASVPVNVRIDSAAPLTANLFNSRHPAMTPPTTPPPVTS